MQAPTSCSADVLFSPDTPILFTHEKKNILLCEWDQKLERFRGDGSAISHTSDQGSVWPRILPPETPGRGCLHEAVMNFSAVALNKVSNSFCEEHGFTPVLNTRHKTVLVRKSTSSPRGCRCLFLRLRAMPPVRLEKEPSCEYRTEVAGARGEGRCLPSSAPGAASAAGQSHRPRSWELGSPMGINFPGLTYTPGLDPKKSYSGGTSHGEFF